MVRVPEGESSALKKEVLNIFVATIVSPNICEREVEDSFCQVMRVAVEVKRLNQILFWVKPMLGAEFQCVLLAPTSFYGSPLRRLDRWTEVLGPTRRLCWVRMKGIPLHVWGPTLRLCWVRMEGN